jgi:hypothetical protein
MMNQRREEHRPQAISNRMHHQLYSHSLVSILFRCNNNAHIKKHTTKDTIIIIIIRHNKHQPSIMWRNERARGRTRQSGGGGGGAAAAAAAAPNGTEAKALENVKHNRQHFNSILLMVLTFATPLSTRCCIA